MRQDWFQITSFIPIISPLVSLERACSWLSGKIFLVKIGWELREIWEKEVGIKRKLPELRILCGLGYQWLGIELYWMVYIYPSLDQWPPVFDKESRIKRRKEWNSHQREKHECKICSFHPVVSYVTSLERLLQELSGCVFPKQMDKNWRRYSIFFPLS